ncbi:MAG TPA: diacylglycerol kinase family protein [Chitinophagaceae bacterium]|jgi:diacylglycerol kinase|nr:diacylglycerol kinase family protein [Chitinophagaceae bacterium]
MKTFFNAMLFALQGIKQFISKERNGKIQIVFGATAIMLGFTVSLTSFQWLLVLFCIGLVISLEMINSAIERYCDLITTDFHPGIKVIKDMAAGAVLMASITSLIIGLIIFIPALVQFLNFLK